MPRDVRPAGCTRPGRPGRPIRTQAPTGDLLARWHVVVPVKRPALAKTRLGLSGVPSGARSELVVAMAADVLAAVSALGGSASLLGSADALHELSAPVIDDRGLALSAAVAAAAAGLPGRVCIVMGDLPGVTAAELETVLADAGRVRFGALSDHEGAGTTVLTARTGSALRPSYGPGSFARHLALGATPLAPGVALAGLRHDVDTVADLDLVAALPGAVQTRRVWERVRPGVSVRLAGPSVHLAGP